MKDLSGVRVTFTKGDLTQLDDGQRKILCVFPHILNRLKVLESHAFSHMNVAEDESLDQAKREVALCAFVESVILLAGEMKEASESISNCYYGTQVSKSLHEILPDTVKEALKRLPAHFSGNALAPYLRNNFAFHNSPEPTIDVLNGLPDDDEMFFYLIEEDNNYFEYASRLRLAAIADHLGLDDWTAIIRSLADAILSQVYNDVYRVLNGILSTVLGKVRYDRRVITVRNVPSNGEMRANVFSLLPTPTEISDR